MELYNPDNVTADLARIEAEIEPRYAERLAAGTILRYEIRSGYLNMNRFWAAVEYDIPELDRITAHYTILIRDGRIEFQNNPL